MRAVGEQAYAWAKASALVGSSFLGHRVMQLSALVRPSELDRLIFPDSPLQLPERELSVRLQRRIAERSAARSSSIVSSFSSPVAALVRLLRAYEYSDLKSALAAAVASERSVPPHVDIGSFSTIRWDAYPNIARMTFGTEFSWIKQPATDEALLEVETELDSQYYKALWEDVARLPLRGRAEFEAFVAEEISLKNIVWSLRLRSYYGIEGADLDRRMLDIRRGRVSFAQEARVIAAFSLDRREDWKRWNRASLLNPEMPGKQWRVDPRAVQNAATRRLYTRARHLFRMNPFSVVSLAAFIKLTQFEEDVLTSVAEGLALGLSGKEVVTALEVPA